MMKKSKAMKLIVASLLAFSPMGANAQKSGSNNRNLVGIWQVTLPVNEQLRKLSAFKVYGGDGTFTLFTVSSTTNIVITGHGTYEITSDSTYTEHVDFMASNKDMDNTESQMRYKKIDDQTLLLKWYNKAIDTWTPEIWMRVKEMPYIIKTVPYGNQEI